MASISITWVPTTTNSVSQDVQYKEHSSSTWITFATVAPTDSSALITGLSDNVIYDVRIVNNCTYGNVPSTPQSVISLTCPVITYNTTDDSIDYSFTGTLTGVSSYEVQLLSVSDLLLQTQSKAPATTVSGTFTGLLGNTTYKIKLLITSTVENKGCTPIVISTSVPVIPCGSSSSFTGGQSYPTLNVVTLGSGLGTVTLTFDAYGIPDKFIVTIDGTPVLNTGYRGDSNQQANLDAALSDRGLPSEPIVGGPSGSMTFEKTTASTTAEVEVWAPIAGTAWQYTLSCPVDVPCPTITVAFDVENESTTTAKVTANPSGGTAPYTYNWSNGQTTQQATGLVKNTEYTLIVTDSLGCIATENVTPDIQILTGLKMELMYFQNNTAVTTDPFYPRLCFGGHTCNNARFEFFCNGVSQGIANLNNIGGTVPPDIDDLNYPPPGYDAPSGQDRYWSVVLSGADAAAIAGPGGVVNITVNYIGTGSPHSDASWVRISKEDGTVLSSTCMTSFAGYTFDPYS